MLYYLISFQRISGTITFWRFVEALIAVLYHVNPGQAMDVVSNNEIIIAHLVILSKHGATL